MDEEFRNDNTIFPTDEDLKNSFIMVPIQPAALKFMVRQMAKRESRDIS